MATEAVRQFQEQDDQSQALLFYSRERRRSLAGIPRMHRTHRFGGSGAGTLTIDPIDHDAAFPDRSRPITLRSACRIVENAGVHRGVQWQFGPDGNGRLFFALQDTILAFGAGGLAADDFILGIYSFGGEIPPGLLLDVVCAANPGNGRIMCWANGTRVISAQAANGTMGGSFCEATPDGYFTKVGKLDGYESVSPLDVYYGQLPREFVV